MASTWPDMTSVASTNTIQFAIKCRWCGKDYTGATSDDSCPDCSAAPSPIIGFVNNNQGKAVHLWHNPDNSLFLEFVHSKKDLSGVVRATRYILSEAILSRTGALKEFDKDPKGKK